jgi:hypothetical protein
MFQITTYAESKLWAPRSDAATEVALRNEEVNRRRLATGRNAVGGPLKITDPAAFNRLMSEMKLKAEEQRWELISGRRVRESQLQ